MKRVLLLILVLLAAGLLSFAEFYRSEWVVNAHSDVVTISAGEAVFEPWNRIWIASFADAEGESDQGELVAALQTELQERSLNGEVAPRYADEQTQQGPTPVGMLVEGDWELKRSLTGWNASGTLVAQTISFGDETVAKTVDYRANITAAGTYKGWLHRSTVETQLVEHLTSKLAESLANELCKQGQALPQEPVAQGGVVREGELKITWPWSKPPHQADQGSLPANLTHPLIVDGAKVDYYWQLPSRTVITYRVQQTGVQLEEQLLNQVTGSVKYREFQNAVYDRRHWASWDLRITHWAVDTDYSQFDDLSNGGYADLQDEVIWRRVLVERK